MAASKSSWTATFSSSSTHCGPAARSWSITTRPAAHIPSSRSVRRTRCATSSTTAPAYNVFGCWRSPTVSASPSTSPTVCRYRPDRSGMSGSPNRLGPSESNPAETDRDRGNADGNPSMIGIAALAVGIVLGLVFHPSVPEFIQPYLPIPVVVALDAVFGGLRAYLERIFDPKVFVVSFVFNVFVAALIVYVGDQLGVGTQLSTAIIVVLGIRIFGNAAALRRRLFGA